MGESRQVCLATLRTAPVAAPSEGDGLQLMSEQQGVADLGEDPLLEVRVPPDPDPAQG